VSTSQKTEARRNILLLAVAQALYSSCIIIVFATAALVGLQIAPSPGYATYPVTCFVLGAMFTTIPASFAMQRFGRTPIFQLGALSAVLGAALASWSIWSSNFILFCFACAAIGVFQATSGFYRFAAAESADDASKPIAISWVLTGGVVAAILGTMIAIYTNDLFPAHQYAGSYLAVVVLALLNILVMLQLRLPPPVIDNTQGVARPWVELLRQPKLVVAMASAMIAYALMNLMMTATPVAMIGCGFTGDDASYVIQWHVLAMFVPSFFTGQLIKRFGTATITALGMIILLAAAAVGYAGITFSHFSVALILLGLGWNFGFIGGTTLLTESYRPTERAKVQAANDFSISLLMAIASASSGQLLANFGWESVPMAIIPPVTVALLMIAWLQLAAKAKAL
jgi:predicted MFS family arabinose efflux permease